jgi:hypothetical protein
MIAAAMWAYWWRNALHGDYCTRCLQPGHVAASCTHKLWRQP